MRPEEKIIFVNYKSSLLKNLEFTQQDLIEPCFFYNQLKPHFPKQKNAKILDLACGGGDFLYYLDKQGYTNAMGIDISDEYLELCRLKGLTTAKKNDIFSFLKNKYDEYDLIMFSHVIEHLNKADTEKILPLLHSALKKEGNLIIITPNMANPNGLYYRYMDYTHKIGFTETSLMQILSMKKFKKIIIKGIRKPAHGLSRKIVYKIIIPFYYFLQIQKNRLIFPGAHSKILDAELLAVCQK